MPELGEQLLPHALVQGETAYGHVPLCMGRGLPWPMWGQSSQQGSRWLRPVALATAVMGRLPVWLCVLALTPCTAARLNVGTSCNFTGSLLGFMVRHVCMGWFDS